MPQDPTPNPELPANPSDPEALRRAAALDEVVKELLTPEDAEFMEGMDDEDERIGYAYGRLIEEGHDPDEVLETAGVTEAGDEV